MSKKMRNALVFAKLETTYGVDPTPTGPLNAILCRGITPQPITAEYAERPLVRPYLGANGSLPSAVHSELELEVELAGAGAAGSAPKWAPLLLGCGFAETLTALTSAVYKPVTDGMKSLTLYYFLDGILHVMTGARGTVSFALNTKGVPVMSFRFLGKYATPTDTTMPADADYSDFITPVVVNDANTPGFTLHGEDVVMETFSIDMANQVIFRTLVGKEGVEITDRAPTGGVNFELGAVSEKDWWTAIQNAAVGPFTMTHGTVAGNIVQIDAPAVQLINPSYGDSDGVAMLALSLAFQPDAGNDELVITVK